MDPGDSFGGAIQFFIYDTVKILLLLVALIYVIAMLRARLNLDMARKYLSGKGRTAGYFLGALFGSITPFCSCSSIPLFLGFASARIPFGAAMAFLITSPLINELALVLLWGLLGWRFTIIYTLLGLCAGILGGYIMDLLRAERWLQPGFIELASVPAPRKLLVASGKFVKLSMRDRHNFARNETISIFKRV